MPWTTMTRTSTVASDFKPVGFRFLFGLAIQNEYKYIIMYIKYKVTNCIMITLVVFEIFADQTKFFCINNKLQFDLLTKFYIDLIERFDITVSSLYLEVLFSVQYLETSSGTDSYLDVLSPDIVHLQVFTISLPSSS